MKQNQKLLNIQYYSEANLCVIPPQYLERSEYRVVKKIIRSGILTGLTSVKDVLNGHFTYFSLAQRHVIKTTLATAQSRTVFLYCD